MALKDSINLEQPDRQWKVYDNVSIPLFRLKRVPDADPPEYETEELPQNFVRTVATHKMWFACTHGAINAAVEAYTGSGALQAHENNRTLNAWDLEIVEKGYEIKRINPEEVE